MKHHGGHFAHHPPHMPAMKKPVLPMITGSAPPDPGAAMPSPANPAPAMAGPPAAAPMPGAMPGGGMPGG